MRRDAKNALRVLRRAGLTVVPMRYESGRYAGRTWETVGWNDMPYTELRGVMWHHDASPMGDSGGCKIDAKGYGVQPTGALYWMMYDGFGAAPAAAAWVDRRGVWYVYASLRTNHAGLGFSPISGRDNGNAYFFGIETDHTDGEPWPKAQLDSLRLGTAALMKSWKINPRLALIGHKEYAPGRKFDPDGLDMADERRRVAKLVATTPTGWKALLDKWLRR